jgi:uncharacterized protein with NRDE domain
MRRSSASWEDNEQTHSEAALAATTHDMGVWVGIGVAAGAVRGLIGNRSERRNACTLEKDTRGSLNFYLTGHLRLGESR